MVGQVLLVHRAWWHPLTPTISPPCVNVEALWTSLVLDGLSTVVVLLSEQKKSALAACTASPYRSPHCVFFTLRARFLHWEDTMQDISSCFLHWKGTLEVTYCSLPHFLLWKVNDRCEIFHVLLLQWKFAKHYKQQRKETHCVVTMQDQYLSLTFLIWNLPWSLSAFGFYWHFGGKILLTIRNNGLIKIFCDVRKNVLLYW